MNDIQSKLKEPFHQADIEWRVQSSNIKNGKPWAIVIPYVTSRAVQSRLDDVVGVFGWKNEFKPGPDGGILCGISVKHENEWITKWDGAENTKIEPVKGGLSDSEKRAAVQFGIGRYLYNLEPVFAECSVNTEYDNKITFQEIKWNPNTRKKEKYGDPIYGSWLTPQLPAWATPAEYIKVIQIREIESLIRKSNTDTDALFEWLGVNSVSRIKKDKFDFVAERLRGKVYENERQYAVDIRDTITLIKESKNENMLNAIYLAAARKIGDDEKTLLYVTREMEFQKENIKKLSKGDKNEII